MKRKLKASGVNIPRRTLTAMIEWMTEQRDALHECHYSHSRKRIEPYSVTQELRQIDR